MCQDTDVASMWAQARVGRVYHIICRLPRGMSRHIGIHTDTGSIGNK